MPKPVLKHLACVFQLKKGTDFSGHGRRAVKCPLLRQERALMPRGQSIGQESELGGGLERPMSSEGCIVGRGQR